MNYKIFYFYFSKVDPSENRIAAKSLSKIINDSNMRRMKVNAQVTAVITLLEAFGNCVIMIIVFTTPKLNGYEALIPTILLDFVLLPYAFLMNTSHNKDRVIEDGWNSVFKNVFRICNKDPPLIGNEMQNRSQVDVQPKPSKSDTVVYAITTVKKNDII